MKNILVTGDTGGLGSAIVAVLLQDPEYYVIGISRRGNETTALFTSEHGDRYVHLNYDLDDVDGIKDLYKKQVKPMGPIYGLVNNSAYGYDDIVTNLNSTELTRMYRINVFSPMMLTKYAIRDMLLRGTAGSIVHISSVSAHTAYKGLSMYASTKGALEAFSKGVAREWGEVGIRSNCVCPGFMETAMSSTLSKERKDRIYQRTSLKQPTDPYSVAKAVLFLLSDSAKSITGTVVHVDSGTI